MANNKAPIMAGAVLVDKAFGEMQDALVDGLPWLDKAFGRAQRITRMAGNRRIVTPNVYAGGSVGLGDNDYIEVSPDSGIGNFSFFTVDDPEILDWDVYRQIRMTTPFSLIVWFDLRRVYGEATNRNTEYLKAQIIDLLNGRTGGWHLNGGHIRLNRCYEKAENIYRGFTLDEVDNQYLMHPYGGFRFDGELILDMPCQL